MYLCTWRILCPVTVDLHVIPLSVITLWDALSINIYCYFLEIVVVVHGANG